MKRTPGLYTALPTPPPSREDHGWRAVAMCGKNWMVAAPKEATFESWNHASNATFLAAAPKMLEALNACAVLFAEALPKFDWGRSALDANAIRLLNEVPGIVRAAILEANGGK